MPYRQHILFLEDLNNACICKVLSSVLSSVVTRVFLALGIGIISYSGMQFVLDQMKDWILNTFNGLPVDIYYIFLMAGFGVSVGYIFGAYAFVVTYQLSSKLVFGLGK